MKNRYMIAFAAAALLAAGCTRENLEVSAPEIKVPMIPSDVVSGELLVKFDPKVCEILETAVPAATKAGRSATRSGVVSVDEVLDIVGTYQIERAFPKDTRTEARTREAGLHQWYVVRYGDEFSDAEVAKRLAALGEVKQVNFNRVIRRAYDTKRKAVPVYFSAASLRSSGEFDDPLLPAQWGLVNDGKMFVIPAEEEGDQAVVKSVEGADVQVSKAWELTTGDPSIVVAVLDEGVCLDHPDLKDNLWVNPNEEYGSATDGDGNGFAGDRHGYNFISNSGVISWNDYLDTGHGTHVAGTIAARNNNGQGVSSIAGGNGDKPGVQIMSCQIFSGETMTTNLTQMRAIKYAADNGAVVLQCSWGYLSGAANTFVYGARGYATDEEWFAGGPLDKSTLDYFIHNAGSPEGVLDGGIAVFAAGNEYAPMAGYPGAYKDYVSVAATAADYTPAVYTNYGPGVTISAPGGDPDYYYEWDKGSDIPGGIVSTEIGEAGSILSTLPFNISDTGYGYMEGTSMACPHVSGVIALGLSYAAQLRKHFTADEFKELLYQSVTDIDSYMSGTKVYWDYASEAGDNNKTSLNKSEYKGKMGAGQANATRLLELIADDGNGIPMVFPNVFLSVNGSHVVNPSLYFDGNAFKVTIENTALATATVADGTIEFKGLKEGTTKATVTDGSVTQSFVITVRKTAGNEGWL